MIRPFGITGLGHERYDRIGPGYAQTRRPDPRIAAAIWAGLGDAGTVLNVGAGAGNYEPSDRDVVALEPSAVMIAQRPPGAAPAVQGRAERLPFEDHEFDAVMTVLSDHHWADRRRGLVEVRRVAGRRVVLFNADPSEADLFWLTTEYLPEFLGLIPSRYRQRGVWAEELRDVFGPLEMVPVPVPHDCVDGFYGAFWRRPNAYLDPVVRAGISVFAQLDEDVVERALGALREDLHAGIWGERHQALLALPDLHLGYYVVVAEVGSR